MTFRMIIPRKYSIIIGGLGFSNLGNWIYVVALNLLVWPLTQSPRSDGWDLYCRTNSKSFNKFGSWLFQMTNKMEDR